MGFAFNPFTGNFDLKGSGGGSAFFAGEVATYADLPLDGTAALNSRWLVRSASGTWPFPNYRQGGIYIRTSTVGASRDNDYTLADTRLPDVFADSAFLLYDNSDSTRNLQFDLGSITTGTTRTLTAPDASGRIQVEGQPIGNTTPAAGTFTTLTANNGALTASAPVLDLSQTWNASGTTFTGLRVNVTDTASATASMLADFQVGGASRAYLTKDGFFGNANAGITLRATGSFNRISFFSQGATRLLHNNSILLNEGEGGYGWVTSGAPSSLSFDTGLFRDAAGVVAIRNAANAQGLNIYNTFASATNHERGFLKWSSNVFLIGTEKGSAGGTARALEFQTDGTTRLTISSTGTLTTSGAIVSGSFIRIPAAQSLQWLNRGTMYGTADGVLAVTNFNQDNFGRLCFGGTTSSFPSIKRDSTAIHIRLADDSAFAPLSCGALTLNGNLDASTRDIVTDTTTGTKIGTGTTQKLGFFNATPVVQQAAVADATNGQSTQDRLNDLLARLRTLGLIAT
jgi:hypothetical protein